MFLDSNSLHFSVLAAEYVNLREEPTDMKSITDKAAQTVLWTELIRGEKHNDGWKGWAGKEEKLVL